MSYRTEEEQIAIFKQWWNDNGQALVIGVVLALAVYLAWTTWQKNQLHMQQMASDEFQNLVTLLNAGDSVDQSALQAKFDTLQKDYAGTFYAQSAALLLAKQAADKQDWEKATALLEELVASKPSDEVLALARLRLGKIYYSTGAYAKGVELLHEPIPEAFKVAYYELKGDMLVALEDFVKADQAYEEAKRVLMEAGDDFKALQQKIEALPLSDEERVSATEAPAA